MRALSLNLIVRRHMNRRVFLWLSELMLSENNRSLSCK
jgi:hypothetical protein